MPKDKRQLYHKLTKNQLTKLIQSGISILELLKKYRQPAWCSYPDALSQMMGCWSLCFPEWNLDGTRKDPITRIHCGKCEHYIKKK